MIFQSQVQSTTKNSKFNGLVMTIAFHALILLIILLVTLPKPEEKPMDPFIEISFGEPDMGGPSSELAGGSGNEDPTTEEQKAVQTPSNAQPDDNDLEAIKKQQASHAKTTTTQTAKIPERQVEDGSTFSRKKGRGKGTGTGTSNGPGSSEGSGDGLNPGNEGDPKGSPHGSPDGEFLPEGKRPHKIRSTDIEDENTTDPNPKTVYVIVTVNCDGVITKVKADYTRTSGTKNIDFVKRKLKGEKFYDARPNCTGSASWPISVTVTPN
jgi:hypothetical protein